MPAILRLLLPLVFAIGTASCTGWPRGWNDAKRARTTEGPGGAWIGTWKSESTGHTGKLRCAVFPVKPPKSPAPAAQNGAKPDSKPGSKSTTASALTPVSSGQVWEYRYRASWAHILCAGFTVDCQARQNPDRSWTITGERDLGPVFGGVFTHQATVDGDELEAKYQSAADEGTLSLRRVGS